MNNIEQQILYLQEKARAMRSSVLEMIVSANKGHIGGAFSCIDILVSLYHGGILKYDPSNPKWEQRDRFILSKGHSCAALFAVLADINFFDKQDLFGYSKNGSNLGGHPDRRVPGIEADTGSLGHGLGIGAGMALSAKTDETKHHIIVLMGDGECCEGSVWEGFIFAARHKLSNLTVIIDRNRQCVLDFTEECAPLDPLLSKLEAFGWDTIEVNGHSFGELIPALAKERSHTSFKPFAIIANTIKGKGVSFMEGKLKWHHSVPSGEELALARRELNRNAMQGQYE